MKEAKGNKGKGQKVGASAHLLFSRPGCESACLFVSAQLQVCRRESKQSSLHTPQGAPAGRGRRNWGKWEQLRAGAGAPTQSGLVTRRLGGRGCGRSRQVLGTAPFQEGGVGGRHDSCAVAPLLVGVVVVCELALACVLAVRSPAVSGRRLRGR